MPLKVSPVEALMTRTACCNTHASGPSQLGTQQRLDRNVLAIVPDKNFP